MPSVVKRDELEARAHGILDALGGQSGALLPILQALQEEFGYLDRELVPLIAETLNLSQADVLGVITFYADFRQAPLGRRVVRVCQAEACQAVGARELAAYLVDRFGVAMGETSSDEALTLQPVYCLGNCALGPSMTVDGQLFGRVSAARADRLIAPA